MGIQNPVQKEEYKKQVHKKFMRAAKITLFIYKSIFFSYLFYLLIDLIYTIYVSGIDSFLYILYFIGIMWVLCFFFGSKPKCCRKQKKHLFGYRNQSYYYYIDNHNNNYDDDF